MKNGGQPNDFKPFGANASSGESRISGRQGQTGIDHVTQTLREMLATPPQTPQP